jgi:hypothetical protein
METGQMPHMAQLATLIAPVFMPMEQREGRRRQQKRDNNHDHE